MSERKMLISEEGIEKLKQAELNHYGHSVYFKDNLNEVNNVMNFFSSINENITAAQYKDIEEKLVHLVINVR